MKPVWSAFSVAIVCVLAIAFAGCGGSSPVDPANSGQYSDNPREVLAAFGEACVARDVDAACTYLVNPSRWRQTMELSREALPLLGQSIRSAEETRRERDCIRYRVRMRHPDDPQDRVMENRIYVRRVRGFDGRAGRWGVDFVNPGDGQGAARRQREAMASSESSLDARSGQWGTLYTHASVLTRAILVYYNLMYPQDTEFTGTFGYFNPKDYHLDAIATHPGVIETILFVDYDTYDSMPPDAVLVKNVACALLQAGSADEDVFVGEFNGDGSVNYLRDVVLTMDGGISFRTTNDFGDDDDTFLKGFAHFLTPVTQNTWETNFSEFNDIEVFGGTSGAAVGALDWALGEGSLGPYDIWGIVGMRESRNRKTFQQAVSLMDLASETDDGLSSAEYLANSFYTFGWSLHLLEDLSCPAHARNDMHGVPILSSIPGLGSLQPDPTEEWGETITPTFVNQTVGLFNQLVQEHSPIERTPDGFPGNVILQNLYSTAGHSDYAGNEALFEYAALMTNRLCFSEDTIYTSTNYDAANTDNYPYLTDLELDFFGRSVVYGSGGPPVIGGTYLVACGNGMFDTWRSWFWTTHWFTDPDVNDVEDALHGGWDILTVADDEDEDYYAGSVLGVREQQWRLLFPLMVKVGAAYMHEYYLATQVE